MIEFETFKEAKAAIDGLNGTELCGVYKFHNFPSWCFIFLLFPDQTIKVDWAFKTGAGGAGKRAAPRRRTDSDDE